MDPNELRELGQQLRVDAVRAAAAAGSGHPTSSMSGADLMAVLLAEYLRYDFTAPGRAGNDHLVFSKGHASPLLYAMYRAAGVVSDSELLTFRKLGTRLEGHPTPRLPWVDVATGSLGFGFPVAVGMALADQRLARTPARTWVLCGDSELAEGSVWEAFEHAGHEHLDRLTVVVDVNRLGQRGETRHGWDTSAYARRISAFGWHTVEADGHDVAAVSRAYQEALATSGQPTAVIARTMKGRGVKAVENAEGAHGQPLPDTEAAIAELGGVRDIHVRVHPPQASNGHLAAPPPYGREPRLPRYEVGADVATRTAFGEALAALGDARHDVVVLDGEVADSTRTQVFAEAHPRRFFECYIAEQEMVATAVGMAARGFVPFASTFAAFFTRAHDFVRMAAISRANLKLAGSHAGVSIGEDGPSQMGLEDLAMFRAIHGSAVLYPCDANQTAALLPELADHHGIGYLRTTRGKTPVIYPPGEEFRIGGSKVLRASVSDRVTIVAAGITVHEALRAADTLAADGIQARVVDLYSVKPVDTATLQAAAQATGNFVTVEDHWAEGGLGDAVLAAFANGHQPPRLTKLAVHAMPASATPAQQLNVAGISARFIVAAVHALLAEQQAGVR